VDFNQNSGEITMDFTDFTNKDEISPEIWMISPWEKSQFDAD